MGERHISHELKGKAVCSYLTPVYLHVLGGWFVTLGLQLKPLLEIVDFKRFVEMIISPSGKRAMMCACAIEICLFSCLRGPVCAIQDLTFWCCRGCKQQHADLHRGTNKYHLAYVCVRARKRVFGVCVCVRACVRVRVSSTHCPPSAACGHRLCGNSRSCCRRRCHGPCRASPVRRQWRRDACTRTSPSTVTGETTAD